MNLTPEARGDEFDRSVPITTYLSRNPFLLAPMAGITGRIFRSFMKELGAGVLTTELVSACSLLYQNQRSFDLLEYSEIERPIGAQLFGERAEDLAEASQIVSDLGFDFVDLNFGCPVPKVVRKGGGAAILKDLLQVEKIFSAVRERSRIPVTAKIRIGWDEHSKNSLEVAKIAHQCGLLWLSIHGRTRSAGYSGMVDWNYLDWICHQSPIPIIGNGDVVDPATAVSNLKRAPYLGIMIGRGALKDPWIFQKSLSLFQGQPLRPDLNYKELFQMIHLYLEQEVQAHRALIQLKKLSSWYSHGFSHSSSFREKIFKATSIETAKDLISDFFEDKSQQMKLEPQLPFVSGHG